MGHSKKNPTPPPPYGGVDSDRFWIQQIWIPTGLNFNSNDSDTTDFF